MQEHVPRLRWLVVVALFWAVQLGYLLLPIDLVPDFLPFVGWSDDLASLLVASGVTAWSLVRALPSSGERPAIAGPTAGHPSYEPLTAEEIDRL